MANFIHRFRSFAHNPTDSRDDAFNKLLILLIALSCCLCGMIWSMLYLAVFGPGFIMLLPFLFIVFVGSAILISHQVKDHRPLIYVQLFCITWISALIQWSIGSMDQSGLVIIWSFLGPLGALIFLSFRQAIIWMIMFVLIVFISVYFEPALLGKKYLVSDAVRGLFYIMNLGVSLTVVFASSAWFVSTIQLEKGRSENLLEKIRTLFGQHVSLEVANELIDRSEEGPDSKSYDVTIMFLDIRDFTRFADTRDPREVATFQNIVFGELINIVRDHKGIVNQLLGDGIMAAFGAPVKTEHHISDAVAAGFAMLEKIKVLSDEGLIPPIRVGIGLHSGKVIAGEVGNEDRKLYSLTGSNVIIAARIEQLNKELKSQFLVSEAVYKAVKGAKYSAVDHGKVLLKGIKTPVGIYELA